MLLPWNSGDIDVILIIDIDTGLDVDVVVDVDTGRVVVLR